MQPCEATRVNLLNVNFQLNSINYIEMEQFKLANPSPSIVCSQGMQSWANSNWALSLSPRPLVCLSGPALPVWQSKQRAKFGLNVLIWTTLSTNSLCVLFFPLQFSLPRHFSLDVFVLRAWQMGEEKRKETAQMPFGWLWVSEVWTMWQASRIPIQLQNHTHTHTHSYSQ